MRVSLRFSLALASLAWGCPPPTGDGGADTGTGTTGGVTTAPPPTTTPPMTTDDTADTGGERCVTTTDEPNDDPQDATPLFAGPADDQDIGHAAELCSLDVDYYALELAGPSYLIVESRFDPSVAGLRLTVEDADGADLWSSESGRLVAIHRRTSVAGTFLLRVERIGQSTEPLQYDLRVRPLPASD